MTDIEILVSNQEAIVFSPSELPDFKVLYDLLPKTVDLKYWLRVATEYYKQKRFNDFEAVLNNTEYTAENVESKQSLLLMIGFYALQKSYTVEDDEKVTLMMQVTEKITESENLGMNNTIAILKGVLCLERKNYDQAESHFQTQVHKSKETLGSLVGMALTAMKRKEYKKSLRFWQVSLRAIDSDERFPVSVHCSVRFGIGCCFAKLNMNKEARNAFLRVLDFDPNHSTALVSISSLYLNEMKKQSCTPADRVRYLNDGFGYVKKAFEAMKRTKVPNPIVLTRLADALFMKKDYETSHKALLQAQPLAKDQTLLSEILYYRGRHYHLSKDYEMAQSYYSEALEKNADLSLATFGLGQIAIYKGQIAEAIDSFETVRSKFPNDYDTLRMLAFLHAQLAENPIQLSAIMPTREYEEARESSRDLYARSIELFKCLHYINTPEIDACGEKDAELLVMYARLLESSPLATQESRSTALKLYLDAREVITEVPAELLNNIGVLYHIMGEHEKAKVFYHLAINEIKNLPDFKKECLEVTIMYNIARYFEDIQSLAEAEKFHASVLKKMPSYADSHMRLGIIAQGKGMLQEAAKIYNRVIDKASDNVDAHILLGMLQLNMQQTRAARKQFDKILSSIDKFDLVSLLQLGNIWLYSANKENQDKHLAEAWKLFDKVLQLDPRNPYAANGIAIALREKGFQQESLKLFEQVRECDDKVPCFTINYAHMLCEVGQYKRAIPLYEKALGRFFEGKEVDILVSTARAYFLFGRNPKSAEMLRCSAKYIQRALHIFPKDKTLWFNLAVVLQDHATTLSQERMDKITVLQLREAVSLADLAINYMEWLSKTPSEQYDQSIAVQRYQYTQTIKGLLEKRVDELIATQQDRQKRLEEMINLKRQDEERIRQEALENEANCRESTENFLTKFKKQREDIDKTNIPTNSQEEEEEPKRKRLKKKSSFD